MFNSPNLYSISILKMRLKQTETKQIQITLTSAFPSSIFQYSPFCQNQAVNLLLWLDWIYSIISYCLSTFRLIDGWIFLFQTDSWSPFHIPHYSAYLFTPVSIPTHRSACAPLYSNRIVVTYCRRSTIDFHYTTIELSDNYAIIILPKSKNCVDSSLKQKVYPKLRNGKPNT